MGADFFGEVSEQRPEILEREVAGRVLPGSFLLCSGKRSLANSCRGEISEAVFVGSDLGSPTAGTTLENMAVVKEAIQHGGQHRGVAQQLAPVADWTIAGHQGTDPLVAALRLPENLRPRSGAASACPSHR